MFRYVTRILVGRWHRRSLIVLLTKMWVIGCVEKLHVIFTTACKCMHAFFIMENNLKNVWTSLSSPPQPLARNQERVWRWSSHGWVHGIQTKPSQKPSSPLAYIRRRSARLLGKSTGSSMLSPRTKFPSSPCNESCPGHISRRR